MRERYVPLHKYDSCIAAFVDERQVYDETSGDVECPVGWFGRAGRRILHEDSQGFVTTETFRSDVHAAFAFAGYEFDYAEWVGDSDE